MDRRDRKLLATQLQTISPPSNDGLLGLTVVTVFFAGLALGGLLFAQPGERAQPAPQHAMAVLPDGAPATTLR